MGKEIISPALQCCPLERRRVEILGSRSHRNTRRGQQRYGQQGKGKRKTRNLPSFKIPLALVAAAAMRVIMEAASVFMR